MGGTAYAGGTPKPGVACADERVGVGRAKSKGASSALGKERIHEKGL
jgi:hypothetical protein